MKLCGWSVLAVLLTGTLAQATILSPGGSPPVAPSDFTTNASGPFVATTGSQSWTATNVLGQTTMSGSYVSSVYSDPGNVFCAGCLDFFYTVTSSSVSIDDIERITVASFGSFQTDVGYSTGTGSVSGGVLPSTVDRSSNGATIGFNFNEPTGVAPGQETMVLEIQTNATSFMIGDLQIIDSSVASVTAFQPSCVTPETGSLSLTLLGGVLLGIGFIGRRRMAR